MRWIMTGLATVALGVVVGCGDSGLERHRVSGKVTFKGQPIPYGDVLITPDGSRKNDGAQGIATIRDGQYDTAAEGKGYGGGPAIIRVTGLTAPGGQLICEYELKVNLPNGDATQDIDVPPEGAAKKAKGPPI